MAADKFSINKLKIDFGECLITSESGQKDVSPGPYLSGYQELYKFLVALGTIFSWVASDVKAKMDVLQSAMVSLPNEYKSLNTSVAHERPLKGDKGAPLRNLLRLHRALEYIIGFLKAVVKLESDDVPCAPVSQETYNNTLAKYHPWVMQKAALLAMKMLPNRGGLFEIIGSNHNRDSVEEELNEAILKMEEAYNRMQLAFDECGMLNLP
uniref:Glycolipid transfer protein domain-containing protein 1 n=1 Tax=Caligus clemensi TaxID=344056 RepID=C1C1L0_CALCM|nr:Glycolipid transfer protein domain-containing protein 1 [Caligus clemensi]